MNQIEKFTLKLKSKGIEDDGLWEKIIGLENLKTFQLQMNFIDLELNKKLNDLQYFSIENLVLDILPFSNYKKGIFVLISKMKLKELTINISENPNNALLKAISKFNFQRLNLLITPDLLPSEKEFLIEMLRNSFWILEFRLMKLKSNYLNFLHLDQKLDTKDADEMNLFKIANMNKIKSQIQSNFKFLHKIPRNMKFHFEINRNFILEENPKKKLK
jgi:hypothetical protein